MSTTGVSSGSSRTTARGSTTLTKACVLLRAVATIFPTGGSLSHIAREVGMNTATAHRLLTALATEGLLTFDPYAKTYHIGFDLLRMAESAQEVAPDLRLRHALQPSVAQRWAQFPSHNASGSSSKQTQASILGWGHRAAHCIADI